MQTNEYKNEYRKKNYEQVAIALPKGTRAIWQREAKKRGISMTTLITLAVKSYIKVEDNED